MVTTKAKTQKSSHLLNKQNNYNTVKNNLPQTQIENNNSQYSGLQFPYDTKYKFFKNEVIEIFHHRYRTFKTQILIYIKINLGACKTILKNCLRIRRILFLNTKRMKTIGVLN